MVDQPASAAVALVQFPATELTPPVWVPDDVDSFLLANWDAQTAYAGAEQMADEFLGPGGLAKALDVLSTKTNPPIHLKKDVIDGMTGQVMIIQSKPDAYNASQVLSRGFYQQARRFLGSEFLAGVPNRDFLLALSLSESQIIEKIQHNIACDYLKMDHPLTDQLLVVTLAQTNCAQMKHIVLILIYVHLLHVKIQLRCVSS